MASCGISGLIKKWHWTVLRHRLSLKEFSKQADQERALLESVFVAESVELVKFLLVKKDGNLLLLVGHVWSPRR